MIESSIRCVIPADIKRVWEVITSTKDYLWRSDLSKIEVINDNIFIEYSKNGYKTEFNVTVNKPCERWEFDLENSNMTGHFSAFLFNKDGNTEINLTENIIVKKIIMKPFAKGYLKKQQRTYVEDLKEKLSK